jgi:hypothetical protein
MNRIVRKRSSRTTTARKLRRRSYLQGFGEFRSELKSASRWVTENGVSDFDALHSRSKDDWAMLLAYDILELDGTDLHDLPLVQRKRRLKALLGRQDDGLQFVEHLEGDGRLPAGPGRDREQKG